MGTMELAHLSEDQATEATIDEALSNPKYASKPDEVDRIASDAAFLVGVFSEGAIHSADLAQHARWLLSVRESRRVLADVEQLLSDACASLMPRKMEIIDGLGQINRHPRKSRTAWDKDALRMSVADSRLVDAETGEIVDESPLDRVLHVWSLGAPRVTALRARGLDPDEFCAVETKPGYTIEIKEAD